MRAVVLAAGRGPDLEPLTAQIPAAMLPVLDRPVMAHTVDLLRRHGAGEVIAVLRRHGLSVRRYFGDQLTYRTEDRALGSAGAVRACRELLGDEPFLVVSGYVLTDFDAGAALEHHRLHGGPVTVCVKRGAPLDGNGVVIADGDGRATGFDAEPDPARPPSDLVNTGIYVLHPDVFRFFPTRGQVDWFRDVFPVLLERDVPIHVHEIEGYWAPLATPDALRRGAFDLLEGRLDLPVAGEQVANGLTLGEGSALDGIAMIEPPVWIGCDVQIGEHARLQGPLVVGDGSSIGDGAQLRASVILPGSTIPRETVLVGGVAGIVDGLRDA